MARAGLIKCLLDTVGTHPCDQTIQRSVRSIFRSPVYHELREKLQSLGSSGAVVNETMALDNGTYRQLTLSNTSSRNAMTGSMIAQLGDAVSSYVTSQDNAIIVRGDTGAFCAGSHLDLLRSATADDRTAMCDFMQFVTSALWLDTRPIVCYAQGAAIGGGCELYMVRL